MALTRKKKTIGAIVVVVVVVVLGFVIWFFEPQALFINKTVDEPLPSTVATTPAIPGEPTPAAPSNVTVASGEFRSHDHDTTGKASLIRLADGSTVVRLTDFKTSNGPDVKVWLSKAPVSAANDAKSVEHVDLGDLKGNIGNQNYKVPPSAADQEWTSVYIWCDRFSVSFGAAPLRVQ